MTVAFGLLLFSGGFALGTFALPRHGLRARYYSNLTRSGPPIAETLDVDASTETIEHGAARVWNAFSAEWSGFVVLDRSGSHTFATISDDGSELEVADVVVVRNGGIHGAQEARGAIDLAAGIHPIRLRYEQAGGRLALTVLHGVDRAQLTPLPRDALLPEAMPFWVYRLRQAAPISLGLLAAGAWAVVSYRRRQTGARSEQAPKPASEPDNPRVGLAVLLVVGLLTRVVMMSGSTGILWPDSDVFPRHGRCNPRRPLSRPRSLSHAGLSLLPRRDVAVGFACAAVTLVRPVGQWWVFIVLPFAWFAGATLRQRVVAVGAIAGIYLALLVPWTRVNQQQYGFTGVALGRGLGLFVRAFEVDRLQPATPTMLPEVRDRLDHARARGIAPANYVRDMLDRDLQLSAAQTDELLYAFALETIKAQPRTFAVNSARQWLIQLGGNLGGVSFCSSSRGAYLCSGRTQGHSLDPFPDEPLRDREPVRELVVSWFRVAYVRMAVVLALALFGLVWVLDGRRPAGVTALLALTIAYVTLVPAVTQWPQDRYRLPVDPLLFMFAAAGVAGAVVVLRDAITSRCAPPAIHHWSGSRL